MEIGTFYINGEFVTPKGTEKIALINPATEEEVGFVVAGNEEDVDLAVEAANKAFLQASSLTLEERKTILTEILEGMAAHRDDFAKAISEEMGAPLKMAGSAQYGAGTIHFKNTLAIIDQFKFTEDMATLH